MCYTGKDTNAWHRQATDQKNNTYNNPNELQPAQLIDQAQGTIEKAAKVSIRTTPTITATVDASSTATLAIITKSQRGHCQSSQPMQPSAQAGRAAVQRRHHSHQWGYAAPPSG